MGGHYASSDLGLPFHGYVAGGAQDDHEGTRTEDAIARIRQGMKVMLRHGSAWFDIAAGEVIVEGGQWRVDLPNFEYPADVTRSVRIGRARRRGFCHPRAGWRAVGFGARDRRY